MTILLDQNMARSSHYMQSVVRSGQSAVRSPSFMLRDLKRSTLRGVMLQGYNKSVLPVRNIQLISLKTSRPWYRQALDCRWLNISSKDSSTKTRNTRSLQDDRHLVCSRATSGFTLPFHNRYFWSVGNFVFHKYENQKTIFSFNFTSSNTVSCRICYTWIALLSLKFLIAWILGGGNWKPKVKTTNQTNALLILIEPLGKIMKNNEGKLYFGVRKLAKWKALIS